MQTTFFEDAAIKNRVHCDSLGLPSDVYQRPLSESEANGVPLSPEEVEIADLMARGINRRGAEMFVELFHLPPTQAVCGPRQRTFHAVVEYARTPEQLAESTRLFGEALGTFYDACRSRSTISPYFVGD